VAAPFRAVAQRRNPGTTEPTYVKESVLAAREFPLLSMMLEDAPVREVLAHDPALHTAAVERWKNIEDAKHDCKGDVPCESRNLQFTTRQIEEISAALHCLYQSDASLREFAHVKLKPAALFSLDASDTEESILIDTWKRSAQAMDQIIATYANGTAPRYPDIDSMTYAANSKSYSSLMTILLDDLSVEETAASPRAAWDALFFEPTLRFSIRLLQSNSRDEAGRFWPLRGGENSNAAEQIVSTQWTKFPYSVIVIPGAGSEVGNVPLSPWGKERVRLGVRAYRSGKAPFLLVTGGFVHPSQTPYCEAVEMKRYLMEVYAVPASAILLEPYARHTTTNLRNASRAVFDYGIPSVKPMLIVSDAAQITYIQSTPFRDRTRSELGYLPVTLGKRLLPTELEAIPSGKSRLVDAGDPLDP
jgi:hypothetical protein